MRIVGMPIWIALAMLFLLKMILAYAAGCYGEKKGYQKWLLFVVAVLLDPVAVFAIILMLPSMSSAKEPKDRRRVAMVSALCAGAFAIYLVIAGLAISRPAVPDLANISCQWIDDDGNWFCYFEDAYGPSGQDGEPVMLKGLHVVGSEEYYFVDSSRDLVLIRPGVPDGALVKDSEYLEILGEEGLIAAAAIDASGQVHKIVIPYVL